MLLDINTQPFVYKATAERIREDRVQQNPAIYEYSMVQTREGAQHNEWLELLKVVGAENRKYKALQDRQKHEPWTEVRPIDVPHLVQSTMSNQGAYEPVRPVRPKI